MLLGAIFIRRLVKLEKRSPIIAVAATTRPTVQSNPIQGAPKVVATIESATPRKVLERPNKGCPSAKVIPPSRKFARAAPRIFLAIIGTPFAKIRSTRICPIRSG
jgi:hypothetical protein